VAHEINNPLGIIILAVESVRAATVPLIRAHEEIARLAARGTLATVDEIANLYELAETGGPPGELIPQLDDADSALRTIMDIVRGLRIFARADPQEKPDAVYLPDLTDQVLRIVGAQISSASATIERDYGADLPTLVLPRSRITQVLTNLLINAAHAVAEVRRPMHRVRVSIRYDAEAVAISVTDTGPGISPEIIERIFDPFFTTKRSDGAAGGTGLGLSISRSILQDLGGDLIVESVHGNGATFIAVIPTEGRRVARPARSMGSRLAAATFPQRSVLVVEDEEALLRSIATVLRRRFHVLLAADGQEAIDLLASGSKADAILCDLGLPVVSGPQFYDWLQENRPELARHTVFITANVVEEKVSRLTRAGKPVLEKPVTRDQLLSTLDRVMASP
jgi:CheY-like chemotaxis protein